MTTATVKGAERELPPAPEWVFITPDIAKALLALRTVNRKLRKHKVTEHADALRAGHWGLTLMPICLTGRFDFATLTPGTGADEPMVIDGQHRLTGIVDADTGSWQLVQQGLKVEDQTEIDTNLKRSLADQLHLRGYPNAQSLGAVGRLAVAYDTGRIKWKGYSPSLTTILRFVEAKGSPETNEFNEAIRATTSIAKTIGGKHSVYATFYWAVLQDVEGAEVDEDLDTFVDKLTTGAFELPADQPIYKLREAILASQVRRTSTGRIRRFDQITFFALMIKAWNSWREGLELTQLSWRSGGKTAEEFPTPI